jgi:hypothetical protein
MTTIFLKESHYTAEMALLVFGYYFGGQTSIHLLGAAHKRLSIKKFHDFSDDRGEGGQDGR